MKQLPSVIGWLLLIIGFSLYLYGICYAIFFPDPIKTGDIIKGYSIPEPLDILTSTLGAILLTNLGAVLGISVVQPQSALASKTLISKSIEVPPPMNKRELIQFLSVIIYIASLVACFITWALHTFGKTTDIKPIVPLIEQYGKTLIGVITVYIAFVLGVNKS